MGGSRVLSGITASAAARPFFTGEAPKPAQSQKKALLSLYFEEFGRQLQ
jgi:hypothetical protein